MRHYFAADRNLGKLSKYLRLIGFDTQCEPFGIGESEFWNTVAPNRKILIRSRRHLHSQAADTALLIRSNYPIEQLKQVLSEFEITADELQPFSRCTLCNLPLSKVEKQAIRAYVPDYTWQTQQDFRKCNGCERIYWPGTHRVNSLIQIKKHLKII